MLTGRQIREARELLGLTPSALADKIRLVTTATVKKAESAVPGPPIADSHLKAIVQKLEALGIEFTPDGPRLRTGETTSTQVEQPVVQILTWLAGNKGATALEIGRACGIDASVVRERLVSLERHALVAGRPNGSIPPRRLYFVTMEGRRAVGLDDEVTVRR